MTQKNEPQNYEVGYGKPPKHSQFKKGESGNLKGRPAGRKNYKTELLEELSQSISFTENGQQKSMSKLGLMLRTLANKAIKGDPRSIALVLRELAETLPEASDRDEQPLSEAERDIFDDFVRRRAEQVRGGQDET